jgi:GT2 family glycosyltransferase
MTEIRSTLAVCIAAFNRRERTLACLRALHGCTLPEGLGLEVYLLDDASTDGTGAAVRAEFPAVTILQGTGSLFWAGGMRVAYGAALARDHAYYLWMNDDVVPRPDALVRLVETERALCAEQGRHHLVSGGMWDSAGDAPSYGGYNLASRINPSRIDMVLPDPAEPRPIDLTNANMLLIPRAIARTIGNIPPWFTHTLADWDYGLRARRAGFGTTLAPGFAGECEANVPWRRRWHEAGLSLRQRYRAMLHPLALPFLPRARFLFTHFPMVAPLFAFTPYLKLPFDHLLVLRHSADEQPR